MKVLTYGSYGGLRPKVLDDYALERRLSLLASPELVDFVEGFETSGVVEGTDKTCELYPDRLSLVKRTEGAYIRKDTYAGMAELAPAGHVMARVTVNEYDPELVDVVIKTHDGAETLEPLPRYAPVVGIPGLYREIS